MKICVNANNRKYQPHRTFDTNSNPPVRIPLYLLEDGQSYECDDCRWKRKMNMYMLYLKTSGQIPKNRPQLMGFDVKAFIVTSKGSQIKFVDEDAIREEFIPAIEAFV